MQKNSYQTQKVCFSFLKDFSLLLMQSIVFVVINMKKRNRTKKHGYHLKMTNFCQ